MSNQSILDRNDFFYGILHNRKTGGTALKQAIEQQKTRTTNLPVVCFDHSMTFPKFVKRYPQAQAIFFVRDPISRYLSGFYSRLRQGQPRYLHPWNRKEAKAFARFDTPNKLAEALSSRNLWIYFTARQAMKSIGHVKHTFLDFLGEVAFLKRHRERIAYIGYQPEMNRDFDCLRKKLMIDEDIEIAKDDVHAHKNPDHLDLSLSDLAKHNLKKWYKIDFEIYEYCLQERRITRVD